MPANNPARLEIRGLSKTFGRIRALSDACVGSLKLTPAAEATGEWFGSTDFQSMFTKLWGL